MNLSFFDRLKLNLQNYISYILTILLAYPLIRIFFYFMRYKIHHLAQRRQEFLQLVAKRNEKPTLICLNHLTRFDSLIFAIYIISVRHMLFNYSLSFWHILEGANLPILSSLLKAIPIARMGDRKQIRLMQQKVKYLLGKGDLVGLFPEGTRSETGKVDVKEFQYGVGDLIKELPGCKVLCVYFRGDKQIQKSNIPNSGSKFDISFKMIEPTTQFSGPRASKDLAGQVIHTLAEMENEYFAKRSLDR